MLLPSGVQLIWQPSPVLRQVFLSISQTPVSRFDPRKVMAMNLPSRDSSGCCKSAPSKSGTLVLSTSGVSSPVDSFLRRTSVLRTNTMSSGPDQLAQLPLSTTFVTSVPSGFTV